MIWVEVGPNPIILNVACQVSLDAWKAQVFRQHPVTNG